MAAGRPKKEFKPEFCEMIIEHFKQGGTIRSFGAKCGASHETIYGWLKEHPEFNDARNEGAQHQHEFYQNMGKMLATGQLRRLKSETVARDKQGNALFDKHGNPVMDRVYEPTTGSAAAWIFMCKNILHWRDKQDIEMSGKGGGPINFSGMTDDELKKKLKELAEEAKKFTK